MARAKGMTIKYIDEDLKSIRSVSSGEPIDYISSMGSSDQIPFRTGYSEYRVNDRVVTPDQFEKVVNYLSHGGWGELKVDYGDRAVLYVNNIAREVEYHNSPKQYFNSDGVLHREDGPAFVDDKTSRYYWEGQRISKDDHQARITEKKMIEKKMIEKNSLRYDPVTKQLEYSGDLYFTWKVPKKRLEVIEEFVKNPTGKRFFELTSMSGNKEIVQFENGQINTRVLETSWGEKTFKYQNDKLVEYQMGGEIADIAYKKTNRELSYECDGLSFTWKVPENELQKVSNWIINDLCTNLTVILENLDGQKEEVFFKGEELVRRVVGPEGTWWEYKDGKQVMEKAAENLLDLCRNYSFPSEYFGVTNFNAEEKRNFENGWQICKDGTYHCEMGPSLVRRNNLPEYYLGGQRLSKEEWLCLTDHKYSGSVSFGIENDKVSFFKDGNFHREFGPAIIDKDGTRMWYKEGKLHREDGPALISYDEVKWAIDGQIFDAQCVEFEEAKKRYHELQQRKDRPVESPHIRKTLGLKEYAEAFLIVNAEDDDYSWIISREVEGKRQSFFIDLKEMRVPKEIFKSQEFGEALLEPFLEERWYNNWYSVSTDKKLDKIAKKYLDIAESQVEKTSSKISLLKKQQGQTNLVPFVKLAEEELKKYTQAEGKNKFMDQFTQDLLKEIKKQEEQKFAHEQVDELELVNRTLKKIDECHKDESKIDDLLRELTQPRANGELFIDQIKSIKNKTIIIDAVAGLAQSLIVKDVQDRLKKAEVPVKVKRIDPDLLKESMVFEEEEKLINAKPFKLPPETKKDKAKKSLGIVKDATKQGVKIGVATEGANIAYDSVKNMLVNVLGISPKALESKVNQELIMMTALAMTHLAAEIYSDKVNAGKIQDLCGLVMEGKVKDNTGTLLKMVPMLMNVSKKMDIDSKLRFDAPEITAQEVLPEELIEALNEAEEMEEEYARNQR
jgi:hypothetical protein